MATPYSNTVGMTSFDPDAARRWVAMLPTARNGVAGWHSGVTLTFSFPTGRVSAIQTIAAGASGVAGSASSSARAICCAVQHLATWSRFANVSFVQSADNSATVGELRFAHSNTLGSREAAHAYFPSTDPSAGDVWFNPRQFNTDGGGIPLGSYDFFDDPARGRPRARAEASVRAAERDRRPRWTTTSTRS